MPGKFNSVLQERVDEDRENQKRDEELRKEYGIEDGRSVGIKVHKDSAIISIWKVISSILNMILTIIIVCLAIVGLVSLVHPGTREVLLTIWNETYTQLSTYLPFL